MYMIFPGCASPSRTSSANPRSLSLHNNPFILHPSFPFPIYKGATSALIAAPVRHRRGGQGHQQRPQFAPCQLDPIHPHRQQQPPAHPHRAIGQQREPSPPCPPAQPHQAGGRVLQVPPLGRLSCGKMAARRAPSATITVGRRPGLSACSPCPPGPPAPPPAPPGSAARAAVPRRLRCAAPPG